MKTTTLFGCHCLLFAWYAFLVYSISALVGGRRSVAGIMPYGGQWKFLTVINLLLQAIFYGISFLTDAFVLMKKYRIAKPMFSFRDLLFGALAFPASMFVFAMFWTLYLYDREMVYPKSIDFVIPAWINHAMVSANAGWVVGNAEVLLVTSETEKKTVNGKYKNESLFPAIFASHQKLVSIQA
ncbi:hypothetical protein lerEdw1_007149 [Lerista edwardsae]|nr:hypothetical protein lerEdw1_007149 [Lerista edwardsae]